MNKSATYHVYDSEIQREDFFLVRAIKGGSVVKVWNMDKHGKPALRTKKVEDILKLEDNTKRFRKCSRLEKSGYRTKTSEFDNISCTRHEINSEDSNADGDFDFSNLTLKEIQSICKAKRQCVSIPNQSVELSVELAKNTLGQISNNKKNKQAGVTVVDDIVDLDETIGSWKQKLKKKSKTSNGALIRKSSLKSRCFIKIEDERMSNMENLDQIPMVITSDSVVVNGDIMKVKAEQVTIVEPESARMVPGPATEEDVKKDLREEELHVTTEAHDPKGGKDEEMSTLLLRLLTCPKSMSADGVGEFVDISTGASLITSTGSYPDDLLPSAVSNKISENSVSVSLDSINLLVTGECLCRSAESPSSPQEEILSATDDYAFPQTSNDNFREEAISVDNFSESLPRLDILHLSHQATTDAHCLESNSDQNVLVPPERDIQQDDNSPISEKDDIEQNNACSDAKGELLSEPSDNVEVLYTCRSLENGIDLASSELSESRSADNSGSLHIPNDDKIDNGTSMNHNNSQVLASKTNCWVIDAPTTHPHAVDCSTEEPNEDYHNVNRKCAPRKLFFKRKWISPSSRKKLCQAMNTGELNDRVEHKKLKQKICYEKSNKNGSLERGPGSEEEILLDASGEVSPAAASVTDHIISSSVHTGGPLSPVNINGSPPSPIKGILKSSYSSCIASCSCKDCASLRIKSEKAITFTQRQMHDIDVLAVKLLRELTTMRNIIEANLQPEISNTSASLKPTDDEMRAAASSATEVEETTRKWLTIMAKDCKCFCKIMRAKEKGNSPVHKGKKKIAFADEAGGRLCHVKIFDDKLLVPKDEPLE